MAAIVYGRQPYSESGNGRREASEAVSSARCRSPRGVRCRSSHRSSRRYARGVVDDVDGAARGRGAGWSGALRERARAPRVASVSPASSYPRERRAQSRGTMKREPATRADSWSWEASSCSVRLHASRSSSGTVMARTDHRVRPRSIRAALGSARQDRTHGTPGFTAGTLTGRSNARGSVQRDASRHRAKACPVVSALAT